MGYIFSCKIGDFSGIRGTLQELRLTRAWSRFLCTIAILISSVSILAQNQWAEDEIENIFDGIDVSAALAHVEEKGVTPYDFGMDLLSLGYPEKAREWFVSIGIHTKDLKYVYGLAWVKWNTGDSAGALESADYILKKDPSDLIRARTLYLIGAVMVDEQQFDRAKETLHDSLDLYAALGKAGGQYLATSMLAMCALYERDFDAVEPLLGEAVSYNEASVKRGYRDRGLGRIHEIRSELHFAQGNFDQALNAASKSVEAYRSAGKHHLADEVQAKVGLLLFLTGNPKDAQTLAASIWEMHHQAPDRGKILAYNHITLMKLSLCAQQYTDAREKEATARAWANLGPGGKALIRLLEWVKEEKNVPCPEWR